MNALRRWSLLCVLGMLALPVVLSSPALARALVVVDDNGADCEGADFTSIQAAVGAAAARSVILVCSGTYHEEVTVSAGKDGLVLRAKGAPGTVVLQGDEMNAGITLENVRDVVVQGFLIRGFHQAQISLRDASSNVIRNNELTGGAPPAIPPVHGPHNGIFMTGASSRNIIEHNFVHDMPDAGACGLQLTPFLPAATPVAASENVIRHNVFERAFFGILLTPGSTDTVIQNNELRHNLVAGVRNFGASGTEIAGNDANDNGGAPNAGFGIDVRRAVPPPATGVPPILPNGVRVTNNKAFGNAGLDLFWDGTGDVVFHNNHCDTSSPPGLCPHGGP